jgi:hypothetical protein
MVTQDQVFRPKALGIAEHFIEIIPVVFHFKANMQLDLAGVFFAKSADRMGVFPALVKGNPVGRLVTIRENKGNMIGKAHVLNAAGNSRLHIGFFRSRCVMATEGMCVIIIVHNATSRILWGYYSTSFDKMLWILQIKMPPEGGIFMNFKSQLFFDHFAVKVMVA